MTKHKLTDVESMSPEQLAQALKNIKVLEAWMHAVKEHAFEVLKNGGSIPGFKLGYGVRHRIWKPDVQNEVIKAMKSMGIDKDELYTQPEFISPPKVEKLLKERSMWPKKARGGPRPTTPLDQFIEYSMPEPRVMPITEHDESNERNREAAEDFK